MLSDHPSLLRSLLLAGAALAVLTLAQTDPPASPPPPTRQGPAPRTMPVPERVGPLTGLEPEERQAVIEILRRTQQEAREPAGRLRQLRRELQAAVWGEKLDGELIAGHARQIGELEGQIAVIRARGAAELRPRLKPGQVERLCQTGAEFWEQPWGGGNAVRPAASAGRPAAVERPRDGASVPTPATPAPGASSAVRK
jgi:uncharacterized membrane protein